MPLDHPAPPERISGHQGVTVAESVNAIAEHFGPLTAEQRQEIESVMFYREAWATREAEAALRREREENERTSKLLRESPSRADHETVVDYWKREHAAAVADRDREREEKRQAALDYLALEGQMREVVAERERYRAAAVDLLAHCEYQLETHMMAIEQAKEEHAPRRVIEIGEARTRALKATIDSAHVALAPPTPAAQESKGDDNA